MLNIINKTLEILKANSEWQERYKVGSINS